MSDDPSITLSQHSQLQLIAWEAGYHHRECGFPRPKNAMENISGYVSASHSLMRENIALRDENDQLRRITLHDRQAALQANARSAEWFAKLQAATARLKEAGL